MTPPEFGPTASRENLIERARLLARVRSFFAGRGVLEVETPVLCAAGAVDRNLDPIPAVDRYLVTSPEHSMKRMLAAGYGPIWQLTRAFRLGERTARHNPEFAILEWYRPGFDHHRLMDEVEALFAHLLGLPAPFERLTYREAFERAAGVDPHRAPIPALIEAARAHGIHPSPAFETADRDAWLDLLLVSAVEPTLGAARPTFVVDYPPSQAALARIRPDDPPVAERFELYVRGLELANGYHELLDPAEQRARFEEANALRAADGKATLPMDHRFLAALEAGIPPCAGVAVGFDRLVMLAVGATSIEEVIAFPWELA